MKVNFCSPRDPISIIDFLATFKPACDKSHNHEGKAMRVSMYLIHETISNGLNSRMYTKHILALFAILVHNQELRFQKRLRSYPEVVT